MSTLVMILILLGIVYLAIFNKPKNHTEDELLKWMSSKLLEISANVETDIAKDKEGGYPHTGQQSFERRGAITYMLVDKQNARFDISDKNTLESKDIMGTAGYQTLSRKVEDMNLSIHLEEKEVEGDGADTFGELDEYIDDFPRYYTVTISGWN